MGETCRHGQGMDEGCPQCGSELTAAAITGSADYIPVSSLKFAQDVQGVYDRLVSALEDPRKDEPGYGTVQVIAVAVLALVTLEVLLKQSPMLKAEYQLMDLLFQSLKLKLMPAL